MKRRAAVLKDRARRSTDRGARMLGNESLRNWVVACWLYSAMGLLRRLRMARVATWVFVYPLWWLAPAFYHYSIEFLEIWLEDDEPA